MVESNTISLFLASSRSRGTELPPVRYITWYGNYAGGGANEASSNVMWLAARDVTNAGLQRFSEVIVQLDDGWTTNRNAAGQLMPSTNRWGTNPEYGLTNLVKIIHGMSPNLLVGQYYEINSNGQTTSGLPGTDQGHIRQDATNAANWGIDYIKLDSPDVVTWNFQQRLWQVCEFAYWYKKTAAALGHRAIVKTDLLGPGFGNGQWTNSDALLQAAIVDVWNPITELVGAGGFQPGYLKFQTNFDNYFLPYYNATVSRGHWMDMEGVVFGWQNNGLTNSMYAQLSIDAFLAMFNVPLHFGAVNSTDYYFVQTNATLLTLNQQFTGKPVLVYQDQPTNPNIQIFRRPLGLDKYALWFWNRQYSNTISITVSNSLLGVPNIPLLNTEVFYRTNYNWTGSTTVTLQPAQSHLVIVEPYVQSGNGTNVVLPNVLVSNSVANTYSLAQTFNLAQAQFFSDVGNAKGYLGTTAAGEDFHLLNRVAANIPLTIIGATAQTVDLQQWWNVVPVAGVNSNGLFWGDGSALTNVNVLGSKVTGNIAGSATGIAGANANTVLQIYGSTSNLTVSYYGSNNVWTLSSLPDVVTNTFSGAAFLLGTNSFLRTGTALTLTSVANVSTSTARWGELTIQATADVGITNPASWKTSDMASGRILTNGNFLTISVEVLPFIVTNAAILQTK